MLAWAFKDPPLGKEHHLTVPCDHHQHPSRHWPEEPRGGIARLGELVGQGVGPGEVWRQHRAEIDSRRRT